MKSTLRRRSAQGLYDLHHGPNMTPMVDVVMVILIFFMASAALLGPEWFLRSHLPTPAAGTPDPRAVTIRVRLVGTQAALTINSAPELSPMDLLAAEGVIASRTLDAGAARITVIVQPEADAPYDHVVRIHETCAELGIERVGLVEKATEKAPEKAPDKAPDKPAPAR